MGIDSIEATPPSSPAQSIPHYVEQLPKRSQHDSTLAKASPPVPAYEPSRPLLDPPSASPLYTMFETLESRTEPLFNQWMKTREGHIEQQFDDIYAMQTEQATRIEESCIAEKNASFWGILEDVGSTVSAAVGFFFGTSATLAGNSLVGGALITSGVLTIGNIAFKHGHVWGWVADQISGNDPKLKNQILTYLPSAVGLSATALSFVGASRAWKYAGQTGLQITSRLFDSTAKISSALLSYKSGMANSDLHFKRAVLGALQSNTDLYKVDLDKLISDVQEYHEHQTDMHATLGKILEERNQAIQQIQQPV